ncbi:MAG: hypothetical protein AAF478_07080 [Pseudomonadota bacterium]
MQTKVGKLIADIECAEKALYNVISQEIEPDPDHLMALDSDLELAFNAFLTAQLTTARQRVDRVRYLLYRIEKNVDSGKLLSTMTSSILEDVMFVFDRIEDDNPIIASTKLNGFMAQSASK